MKLFGLEIMAFFFLVCNRQDFFHANISALVYVLFFLIILVSSEKKVDLCQLLTSKEMSSLTVYFCTRHFICFNITFFKKEEESDSSTIQGIQIFDWTRCFPVARSKRT
ncbi:unnamed protein product [Brassica rapa]|uniref:Uncharacterized protein n=2 Tax=Brassica TaxID=3705 RepID=A0A8D9M3D7_BRACM|nr:unnamed protein product [Brassica napus]CAG7897112.1 unnamed protein product [Brassica rapa]